VTRSSASPPDLAIALLRDLAAVPRATGTDANATARDRVARDLAAAGFQRRDIPFEFSAFPGRWATPIFGALGLLVVQGAGHFGSRGSILEAGLIYVAGLGAMAIGGPWLARRGVLSLGFMRKRGEQMEFTRAGASRPRVWLCAHVDTKSQPVPTLVRAVGIAVMAIGLLVTLVLVALAAADVPMHVAWWIGSAFVTLAGAFPVMLSVVTNRSPGALDNASGVATVVEAARLLAGRDVGVLITDAEELGLAGARAWGASNPEAPGTFVLNCDGVDDGGSNLVMYSGPAPRQLLDGVARAAAKSGVAWRARRLPLGVLTDSVAFTDAGLPSATFSRGTRASLLRVHTRRDNLERLRGTGIADVARLMAATASELGA
jgi:hypothetical protein